VSHLIADITGIHHFSIGCSDADRSIAFYRDLFGMELMSDREVESDGFVARVTGVEGARVRIVHLRGYGLGFELLEYLAPRGEQRARAPNDVGSAHLCFIASDLDAVCRTLSEHGVRFRTKGGPVTVIGGPNDGGKGVYVEDPDGNAVEVVEFARPHPTP
jgi:lactoylglutathione lyase